MSVFATKVVILISIFGVDGAVVGRVDDQRERGGQGSLSVQEERQAEKGVGWQDHRGKTSSAKESANDDITSLGQMDQHLTTREGGKSEGLKLPTIRAIRKKFKNCAPTGSTDSTGGKSKATVRCDTMKDLKKSITGSKTFQNVRISSSNAFESMKPIGKKFSGCFGSMLGAIRASSGGYGGSQRTNAAAEKRPSFEGRTPGIGRPRSKMTDEERAEGIKNVMKAAGDKPVSSDQLFGFQADLDPKMANSAFLEVARNKKASAKGKK